MLEQWESTMKMDQSLKENDFEEWQYNEDGEVIDLIKKQKARKMKKNTNTLDKKEKKSFVEKIKCKMEPAGKVGILIDMTGVEEHYHIMKRKVDRKIIRECNMEKICDKYTFQEIIWVFHFLKAKHYWLGLKQHELYGDCRDLINSLNTRKGNAKKRRKLENHAEEVYPEIK